MKYNLHQHKLLNLNKVLNIIKVILEIFINKLLIKVLKIFSNLKIIFL